MAHHHALGISEILDLILSHLKPVVIEKSWSHASREDDLEFESREVAVQGENTICRRALARAARVCKMFHDPALNILWRELPPHDYAPLLWLLRPAIERVRLSPGCQRFMVWHEIADENIHRFQYYAKRIRIFRYNPQRLHDRVEKEVWEMIWNKMGARGPIFPMLQVFECTFQEMDATTIEKFLTPTLGTLHLVTLQKCADQPQEVADRMYSELMNKAVKVCPNLDALRLSRGVVFNPDFASSFSSFNLLTALELPDRLGHIYPALTVASQLPRLAFLHVHASGGLEDDLWSKEPLTFPELYELHLYGPAESMAKVLKVARFPTLVSLCISGRMDLSADGEEHHILELFRLFRRSVGEDALEVVTCAFHPIIDGWPVAWPDTPWRVLLRCLLPFQNLTDIRIHIPRACLSLRELDIAAIAHPDAPWPDLRALCLISWAHLPPEAPDTLPTHNALVRLIIGRPALRHLALPALDCRGRTLEWAGPRVALPGGGGYAARTGWRCALRGLAFQHDFPIPPEEVQTVAAVLESACPELQLELLTSPPIKGQIERIRRARAAWGAQ